MFHKKNNSFLSFLFFPFFSPPNKLSKLVAQHGGLQNVINQNSVCFVTHTHTRIHSLTSIIYLYLLTLTTIFQWSKIADDLRIPRNCPSRDARLQGYYYKFLLSFDTLRWVGAVVYWIFFFLKKNRFIHLILCFIVSSVDKEKIEQLVQDQEKSKETQVSANRHKILWLQICCRLHFLHLLSQDFGLDMGKVFTFQTFKKMADDMKDVCALCFQMFSKYRCYSFCFPNMISSLAGMVSQTTKTVRDRARILEGSSFWRCFCFVCFLFVCLFVYLFDCLFAHTFSQLADRRVWWRERVCQLR